MNNNFFIFCALLLIFFSILGLVVLDRGIKEKRKEENERISKIVKRYQKLKDEFKTKRQQLEKNYSNLSAKYKQLNESYEYLNARYLIAQEIYPDLDKKIDALNREKAEEVFEEMKEYSGGCGGSDYTVYESLKEVMELYNDLTDAQKAVFPDSNWLESFKNRLEESRKSYEAHKKARELEDEFMRIIRSIKTPTEGDREQLNKAISQYQALSFSEKAYFNVSLYSMVEKLRIGAEEDHRRKERKIKKEIAKFY